MSRLRLVLAGDPRHYMDGNYLMTIRTATTQMLENRLCALAIFNPQRSATMQKTIEKEAGAIIEDGLKGVFGAPEIKRIEFDDFQVVMAYGAVVKGGSSKGRQIADYWFVIMHADELETVLKEVFKLKRIEVR